MSSIFGWFIFNITTLAISPGSKMRLHFICDIQACWLYRSVLEDTLEAVSAPQSKVSRKEPVPAAPSTSDSTGAAEARGAALPPT